jgi:DNA-directed RNA polymerase subunit RPC12/RpoP
MHYSAKSYILTKEEYNYLLPALGRKMNTRNDRYCIIASSTDGLEDILNRLKGLQDNYNEDPISTAIIFECFKAGSIEAFREGYADANKAASLHELNTYIDEGGTITCPKCASMTDYFHVDANKQQHKCRNHQCEYAFFVDFEEHPSFCESCKEEVNPVEVEGEEGDRCPTCGSDNITE